VEVVRVDDVGPDPPRDASQTQSGLKASPLGQGIAAAKGGKFLARYAFITALRQQVASGRAGNNWFDAAAQVPQQKQQAVLGAGHAALGTDIYSAHRSSDVESELVGNQSPLGAVVVFGYWTALSRSRISRLLAAMGVFA